MLRSLEPTCAKKTRLASKGATTVPIAWNDCERFRRSSEYLGYNIISIWFAFSVIQDPTGPQVAIYGFAEVSNVESPDPTMTAKSNYGSAFVVFWLESNETKGDLTHGTNETAKGAFDG